MMKLLTQRVPRVSTLLTLGVMVMIIIAGNINMAHNDHPEHPIEEKHMGDH